ncbi:MAG: thioredoxin [Chloroflexi bacterium]|nr:thioredoxin [Chloroflexota bacterium]
MRAPTLIYWRDGNAIARIEGAAEVSAIRANFDFLLGTRPQPLFASGPSVAFGAAPHVSAPAGGQNAKPIVVTDATFESKVLRSPLPVLVDFWAPWCGPCRMVSPIVEELGREYAGQLRVAKVNSDENPGRTSQLGILGIPTLIFFVGGREVDRVVGAVPKATLVNHVTQVLKGATINR